MKILKNVISIFVVQILLCTPVYALDVIGGASFQRQNIEFKLVDTEVNPTLVSYGIDLILAQGAVFGKLAFSESINDSTETIDGGQQLTYYRTDSDLSLGYSFGGGFTGFIGMHEGKTTVTVLSFTTTDDLELSWGQSGPYVGGSYGHQVGENAVSISVAYASFKADVSRKALTGAVREVTDGETSGLSYGLSLSGPVVESLSYAVALKINRYKFDDEDMAIDNGKDLSTDETYRTLTISLINQF